MIQNPKVIVLERNKSGSYAIAITDGSDNFSDALLAVSVKLRDNTDSLESMMEAALCYAAQRILQLEKGGYSPPPSGEPKAVGGTGAQAVSPHP
ncbi:TPA: hypothetical protein ACGAHI_001297 [Yersinia enterocolitica]|uniref:Uncharacterized protein n=1 Tax=Yersinia pekkanenii TaxID=1288385 RepID=A0A0T9RT15_9GAMM|nr:MULTISPECIES: hypothetical protein [Yersinia]CNI82739.1 Uncharacterised protein [Yersinia pekkanenii]CRY69839.1 Uncharacterised protein [Yersinia pekkanenii]HDM8386550.1 hypothetical protein [Yersinia enterocolitica]